MNLHGLSDSVAGVIESPAQCRQCGATTRLGNGLCLSCTLREGLEGDREESRESFEAILAEDEVRDTHWRVGNYEILGEACKKLGLLCATNCANAYGLWPRWGALCNTRMGTAFCIAILSQETSCLTVRANHS